MENLQPHLGRKLAEVLQKRNIKQRELAEHVGVTQGYISSVLSGRAQPGISVAWKFSLALEIPLSEFLPPDYRHLLTSPQLDITSGRSTMQGSLRLEIWGSGNGGLGTNVLGVVALPTIFLPADRLGESRFVLLQAGEWAQSLRGLPGGYLILHCVESDRDVRDGACVFCRCPDQHYCLGYFHRAGHDAIIQRLDTGRPEIIRPRAHSHHIFGVVVQ